MKISHPAFAGTLESSDLQVRIEPNVNGGIDLSLDSPVEQQFGKKIRQVVLATLSNMKVANAKIIIEDKGALDCVIKARVQAAVLRACAEQDIDWSVMS
ncbi:citrate lyase acyl carrier protein [Celerinatantimonas diazotrophica]|uniref:Citrate lyase acyl carrier protein n=1 Tax=Celerinatantimonas diazotrophica TaxID=412034 RepID=A0A4R1K4D9_9GAMM|nr:citrate lyase acyl carrier protein [Celerinatantimonas diazotrophica]TCK58787.1 citrate lyase subunit gamma (acyl carrier protein) [Celerinatantimonas diazotrophica]CAG9297419.1 Citrate lyase acyl carrier protein [Celerinatantimonas diazotrophica]